MAAKHAHYVVMLRSNGATCGCMGPYASAAAARDEAAALPRANPRGTRCVVVRANGFTDALRAAVDAYRGAGRATAEAARVGVEEAKTAPGRAVRSARRAVKRKTDEIAERVREAARDADWQRVRRGVNAAVDTIEEYGYVATVKPRTLPTQKSTRLNPAHAGVEPLPVRLPRSTVVQSLLFSSSLFNVGQAKSWAKRHGFRFGSVDTGGGRASFIRLRQVDPDTITAGSFRTITLTDGIEAVIGMPKRGAGKRRNPAGSDLLAAAIAPELVAAKAAAGLAARGVAATGRGAASVLSEAGSAFADLVAPRKRANGGPASAVITHTLREPDEGQADYTVTVRLERIGPAGHPRSYVNAEIVTQEAGYPPVEQYDGRVDGAVSTLGYLSRLSGNAKRTRFRKKIEREVVAARDALFAGSR
jgi:hypothetical protein